MNRTYVSLHSTTVGERMAKRQRRIRAHGTPGPSRRGRPPGITGPQPTGQRRPTHHDLSLDEPLSRKPTTLHHAASPASKAPADHRSFMPGDWYLERPPVAVGSSLHAGFGARASVLCLGDDRSTRVGERRRLGSASVPARPLPRSSAWTCASQKTTAVTRTASATPSASDGPDSARPRSPPPRGRGSRRRSRFRSCGRRAGTR